MSEKLKKYLENWNKIEGIKPCNEPEFIEEFINLIQTLDDDRDVTFDGEGSYFGKQITLHLGSCVWIGDPLIHFEIAYNSKKIRVYTARHHGFWRPEYMDIEEGHELFESLKVPFFNLLYRVFGLPSPNKQTSL